MNFCFEVGTTWQTKVSQALKTTKHRRLGGFVKTILIHTSGVLVYQKELMDIAFLAAGFSLDQDALFQKVLWNKKGLDFEVCENLFSRRGIIEGLHRTGRPGDFRVPVPITNPGLQV